MKILNLYAGIGGNRKLWTPNGNEHEITAIENNQEIAGIYKDYFPNDTVIVTDAHQYLLDHHKEFDFIWGSPPCPTHSRTNIYLYAQNVIRYPDMKLYEEIIFLQTFFKGKFVIENVKPYYEPLIKPQISGRHYFWANFIIPNLKHIKTNVELMKGSVIERKKRLKEREKTLNYDMTIFQNINKSLVNKMMNNCVHPEIGLIILDCAQNIIRKSNTKQTELF